MTISKIATRVAAMYWDPRDVSSSEMSPEELSSELVAIADGIDESENPSKSAVAADLLRLAAMLKIANPQTLAANVRDRIWKEIIDLTSATTWDMSAGNGSGLFDTNVEIGKGRVEGFVSFGAKPMVWTNAGIIGGILFRFRYSPKILPQKGTTDYEEWMSGSVLPHNIIDVGELLDCGYYNKTAGGGVDVYKPTSFGDAIFEIDVNEMVIDWQWNNPSATKRAIQNVIDDILQHPPLGAVSQNKRMQQKRNPYTSIIKFVRFLTDQQRNKFYKDEAVLVAQAMGSTLATVVETMKRKGFEYVDGPAPFPVP